MIPRGIKVLLLCLLYLFVCVSCAYTCRRVSVEEGRYWQAQGYQTRIAVYEVGRYPEATQDTSRVYAPGIVYTHHAQAQVYVNGVWKWASHHNLSDKPEVNPIGGGESYAVEEWYGILIGKGLYN